MPAKPNPNPLPVDALPSLARDIADTIGMDGLLQIVEQYGGQQICVHKVPRPDSELASLLGPKYPPFQHRFYGEYLDIPLLHTSREALLVADVLTSLANGEAVNKIASRHRIPRRRVFRIQARYTAEDDSQLSLF